MPFEWSWEHKRLFIKLQVCFSWIWRKNRRKKKKHNLAMASRCNYKDIQQKDEQFFFSNLPVWKMQDNVLVNKVLPCSKRLWQFTFVQTIGYFSIFLNVVFNAPPLPFILATPFFSPKKWLDYLRSPYAATNKWGFKIQSLHASWFHLSLLINLCDTHWCMCNLQRSIHRWIQAHAKKGYF